MWKLLKSEFIKAKSVKSTYIILGAAAAVMLGLTLLIVQQALTYGDAGGISFGTENTTTVVEPNNLWGLATMVVPILFQVTILILPIILITSEWAYGTIRTSLIATPNRTKLFISKIIFGTGLVAIFTFILQILSFALTYLYQNGRLTGDSFWQVFNHGFISYCLAPLLAIALFTLFIQGVAFIFRNSTATIFAMVGVVFDLTLIFGIFAGGSEIVQKIGEFLPQTLFSDIFNNSDNFARGVVGLSSYAVISLGAGLTMFQKKDV
jgi:ABC-type transport system involved in multi-copper enzyme maturation permease subunit